MVKSIYLKHGKIVNQIVRNIFTVKNLWGSIIPLNVLGFFSIYYFISRDVDLIWLLATLVGYVLIKMVGVGAGYHRLISHKAFETSRPVKRFILFLGILSGQGSPILWAGVHRPGHHRFSDTEKDPHSPHHGFWHSYILWMFKLTEKDVNIRRISDLLKDPDIVFSHKYCTEIFWLVNMILLFVNIHLWLFLLILPAFFTFHAFCIQTSLVHYKFMGYQNYSTKDDSVNSIWLFPLSQGEAWHNNHHGDPRNPNFGGRHWWEIDPTYWLIKLLRKQ